MRWNSDSDKWAVVNALRFAAESYAQAALGARVPSIAEQFRQQADTARRLADEIEAEG